MPRKALFLLIARCILERFSLIKIKFVAGHTVAMVIYSATKIIKMCSRMIGWFFDTMIVASTDK